MESHQIKNLLNNDLSYEEDYPISLIKKSKHLFLKTLKKNLICLKLNLYII